MKTNKKTLDRELDKIQKKAFHYILSKIVKYCVKNKWEFSTAYCIYIKDENGDELDTDKNYLSKLVFWYEEKICLFPCLIVTKDGTIYPEEYRKIKLK